MRNLITDVPGLRVGNAQDLDVRTGVTVVLPDEPAVGSIDVGGGAPGTRESDLMSPSCMSEHVDSIVLSGGSLYGLDAASGMMHWLRRNGCGSKFLGMTVPSVPSAIIFDLLNGGDKSWSDEHLYTRLAEKAADAAAVDFKLGTEGAGTGCCAGSIKGGLGSASQMAGNGAIVGALVVANSFGEVLMPGSLRFWAADFERDGELGNQPAFDGPRPVRTDLPGFSRPGQNTTLAVVATDMSLTKGQAQRVAMIAQDGFARAIHPVHTPFDGDVIFVISTARRPIENPSEDVTWIGMAAVECVARTTARGVYEASSLGDVTAYRSLSIPKHPATRTAS